MAILRFFAGIIFQLVLSYLENLSCLSYSRNKGVLDIIENITNGSNLTGSKNAGKMSNRAKKRYSGTSLALSSGSWNLAKYAGVLEKQSWVEVTRICHLD
jgi:hypothetical protein